MFKTWPAPRVLAQVGDASQLESWADLEHSPRSGRLASPWLSGSARSQRRARGRLETRAMADEPRQLVPLDRLLQDRDGGKRPSMLSAAYPVTNTNGTPPCPARRQAGRPIGRRD